MEITPELLELLKQQLIPELKEQVRKEVMDDFRTEEARKQEERRLRKEEETKTINAYSDKMKNSPEPWVDVRGLTDVNDGRFKIEMDWNDAFIEECKLQGISGTSEEQIIQKYLSLLAKNIDDQITDDSGADTPFE